MSFTTWTPAVVSSEALAFQASAWRMVEAQHVASTMKLVDTADEQNVLESLLESSKPPLPRDTRHLNYLLATPFRYAPPPGGSRFRAPADPGVFYGAGSVRTASAELGYWRWRFLRDAVDLDRLPPVAHTAFSADIATTVIDLRQLPFVADEDAWRHPDDYTAPQAFARVAREAGVGGILYRSVRDPQPGWCLALLEPAGFVKPDPNPEMQTWFLTVSREEVTWRRERESMRFVTADW